MRLAIYSQNFAHLLGTLFVQGGRIAGEPYDGGLGKEANLASLRAFVRSFRQGRDPAAFLKGAAESAPHRVADVPDGKEPKPGLLDSADA